MKALQLSRDILQREIIVDRTTSRVFGVFSFIILTALGANVRLHLPFTPVPITLQTFFVLLSGAVLGKKMGSLSQGGYLLLGLLGLSVFTGAKAGISCLFGPTGGYILGFVVASWIVGRILQGQTQNNITRIALAMVIGSLAGIYLFGLLGLSLFLQCSFFKAMTLGFFPFIPGDTVKIISAVFIYSRVEKRCRKIFD